MTHVNTPSLNPVTVQSDWPTNHHPTEQLAPFAKSPRRLYATALAPWTALAAARITSITKSGWESMGTWLLATSVVVAPIRLARKRSRSGWTVRSFLPTMYQLGFDFQAVPPTFASNKSGLGTPWVAQTSFCSCSERSPQKYSVPSGRSQIRPSTTSMWEKTSVLGKLACCV